MFRLLLLVHRYLGIAFGVIVALWCLSGFVMMYVQYPDLNEGELSPTGHPDGSNAHDFRFGVCDETPEFLPPSETLSRWRQALSRNDFGGVSRKREPFFAVLFCDHLEYFYQLSQSLFSCPHEGVAPGDGRHFRHPRPVLLAV